MCQIRRLAVYFKTTNQSQFYTKCSKSVSFPQRYSRKGWNAQQLKVQDINSTALVVHAPFVFQAKPWVAFRKEKKSQKSQPKLN